MINIQAQLFIVSSILFENTITTPFSSLAFCCSRMDELKSSMALLSSFLEYSNNTILKEVTYGRDFWLQVSVTD